MAFEPFIQFMRGIQNRKTSAEISSSSIQNAQQMAYLRKLQKELSQDKVLNIPLNELNVVVIDLETTGFFPEIGDEIISIGAIKIINGKIQENECFYSLIRYEKALSKEIEDLTGITDRELKEAPPIANVLLDFFQFTEDLPLVAHHAKHEKNFLQHACWKHFRMNFKHRILDTSFLYRIAEPNTHLLRLEDFCEHNHIPVKNRHNALGDAILTAKLWTIYAKKVESMGFKSLRDVYNGLAKQ